MATAAELLAEVETALSNCLAAQDYSVAGRQKRMAELRDLKQFRRELLDEISAASDGGGSMCSLGIQVGPSA